MKSCDIFNPYSNTEVTSFYLNVIRSAFESINIKLNPIEKIDIQHKCKSIIVVNVVDAFRAKLLGYKNIVLWVQGIIPEESYLRNNSHIRRAALSMIEKHGLRSASLPIFVSEQMRIHYKERYSFDCPQYYIMPCFNEEIHRELIQQKDYSNNIFVYSGGTDKWQCFEETIALFSKYEKIIPNARLKLMVRDKELALSMLEKYNVKNYNIVYVSPEKVREELRECKFGFCLREDNVINNVATPTKLSSYISNGVMPIYTSAVRDFSEVAKRSKYCFEINDFNAIDEKIVECCSNNVEAESVYNDYLHCFGKYYSKDYHVKGLINVLQEIL